MEAEAILVRTKRVIESSISAPHSGLFVILLYTWNIAARGDAVG